MRSRQATEPRVRIEVLLDESDRRSALNDATFWSLRATPKELPAVWLYDEAGSRLFERITELPEYYLTRAEREILVARSHQLAACTQARTLVELGAGTSTKTRLLLDALDAGGTLERFVPLDASEEVLRESADSFASLYPGMAIHAIVGDFQRHLSAIPPGDDRIVAFLGSTVGNLYPHARRSLFAAVAASLARGEWFLLGVDLVKGAATIEAAYNDSDGVTESFVRNALTVVNRELHADFEQSHFAFDAFWDAEQEWMDIGFHAVEANAVRVHELESQAVFAAGERLRIEVSTKFRVDAVAEELAAVGLEVDRGWTDAGSRFGLLLARRT